MGKDWIDLDLQRVTEMEKAVEEMFATGAPQESFEPIRTQAAKMLELNTAIERLIARLEEIEPAA
jgi:hypothetical protein